MFRSGAPGEGDLVQGARAELLRRARHGAAAERAIELDRRLVVGQRPDHQALEPALRKIAAGGGEKTAPEAQPLKLRPQVDLVDLAVIKQAARPVASVIGVAGNAVA